MKNSSKRPMWRRKRWLIIIVVIAAVFGTGAVREFRISKLPPKERRLQNAQFSFRIASIKYRWGSRMVDGIKQMTGPNAKASQFADYLAAKKKTASEEMRDASYFASIEILGVYTNRNDLHIAVAKTALNGLGAHCQYRGTKRNKGNNVEEFELHVRNPLVETVRTVLTDTQVCNINALTSLQSGDLRNLINQVESMGIRVVTMMGMNEEGRLINSYFVLAEDKKLVEQCVESFFEPTVIQYK